MNNTPNVPHDLESPSPQAVSIIVPTFLEAANIPSLAERIHAALSDSGIAWELLLIDDNSEDGSEAVVAELARRLPVRLVTRRQPTRDLSLSVIEGIRLCRFDRLVVMDADLSHPPERITDLLAALDADCDMVIGSRYAPGGFIDRTWSPWRLLNSRVATSLAFPLVNCSDPMSGFFATDRRVLPDLQQLQPIGYKIALELMVRGQLRVKELPIDFRDRSVGSSKMNWRQQLNFLRHLYRLYRCKFGGGQPQDNPGAGDHEVHPYLIVPPEWKNKNKDGADKENKTKMANRRKRLALRAPSSPQASASGAAGIGKTQSFPVPRESTRLFDRFSRRGRAGRPGPWPVGRGLLPAGNALGRLDLG